MCTLENQGLSEAHKTKILHTRLNIHVHQMGKLPVYSKRTIAYREQTDEKGPARGPTRSGLEPTQRKRRWATARGCVCG